MGQIFCSCAYDIETMTCCVYDADKFHANCYAHSGSVFSVHYLLRQKPYNVMWGGRYVALDDYYKQSVGLNSLNEDIVIDAVPVLTETGGGTMMTLFDGASIETTENLAGAWCGDLLQIVDKLPKKYKLINCCFADMWGRARYCYSVFGTDKKGYILKNKVNKRLQGITYNISQKRELKRYINVKKDENGKKLVTEFVNKQEAEYYNAKVESRNLFSKFNEEIYD